MHLILLSVVHSYNTDFDVSKISKIKNDKKYKDPIVQAN